MVRSLGALVLALALACPAAGAPRRVASINLCTDQLAMLIAAPGQLISVSWLAADENVSLMPEQALAVGLNHGGAEEIYLSRPDLVLAGPYAARPSVQMLERLGVRVAVVPPASSIDGIRDNIVLMGELLGQEQRADQLLARFDADLAAIHRGAPRLATTYAANGLANGSDSLSAEVMRRAGLVLLADRTAHAGGAMKLEQLVMAAPELIVTGSRYDTPSRAESVLDHPALRKLDAERRTIPDRDWICGLPAVAGVVARLGE